MDKRTKKRIQILKDRLKQRRLQLTGAERQPDDPGELERIRADIEAIQSELEQLEKKPD